MTSKPSLDLVTLEPQEPPHAKHALPREMTAGDERVHGGWGHGEDAGQIGDVEQGRDLVGGLALRRDRRA